MLSENISEKYNNVLKYFQYMYVVKPFVQRYNTCISFFKVFS